MEDIWGYIIAGLFLLGIAAKVYYSWQDRESKRAMIEMNERQKRG